MEQRITKEKFGAWLRQEERSEATVKKYLHDVAQFLAFTMQRPVDRELVLAYKETLKETYSISSANSMLAAVNCFLRFLGRPDCCVRQFRVQKRIFCPEERELSRAEYFRLVEAARGNERLSLILQTICATGIRVSELRFITVEAAGRGEAMVRCKGKTRPVFLVSGLRKKLVAYAKKQKITAGSIFITRSGAEMDRSNIWREMKGLCKKAGVSPGKVFPHNLRHLFARTFYGLEKDIVKLADILGHSSINTTRIYTVTTAAEHKRQLTALHLLL